MATKKRAAAEAPGPAKWRVVPRKGLFKAKFSILLEQFQALKAEADRRAAQRGAGRSDVGEVLREVLAAWLSKQR